MGALSLFFAAMFLFAVGGKLEYALPAHETIVRLTGFGDDAARALGVGLVLWEVALAAALGFRWRLRATSVALVATMLFFTIVTVRLAMTKGAEPCGCFGESVPARLFRWDAQRMNLAAAVRNIVLLGLSVVLLGLVWRRIPDPGDAAAG